MPGNLMRKTLLFLIVCWLIFLSLGFAQPVQISNDHRLSNPQPLRADIEVNQVLSVGSNSIKIAFDPVSGYLYYLKVNGQVFQVDLSGPTRTLAYTAQNHGISSTAGFTIVSDGAFFLVGNISQNGNNVGIIKKGELVGGSRTWSTVAQTVPYPLNGHFDHSFNAIAIDPNEEFLYVNSGARTDHGEAQHDSGPLAGLREFPITSILLRIPINAQDLLLENDEIFLRDNGFWFAKELRNTFDLAFNGHGDLIGPENSGDRDDPEEINWIREVHHYGFPWRAGTNDTPQQFAGYDPDNDPLVSSSSYAYGLGFFHDDPNYPPPPAGVSFTDPIPGIGPDVDHYRDPDDSLGTLRDASDLGVTIGTLTAHSSPLGIVFDKDSVLNGEFAGDGFMLNFSGSSSVLGDPGEDLVHLKFTKTNDEYQVQITRLVEGFDGPVDAVMIDNKIYVIENPSGGSLWEVVLPAKPTAIEISDDPAQSQKFALRQNYPNPFNPATRIEYALDKPGFVSLKIYNMAGQIVKTVIDHVRKSPGRHIIEVDMSQFASGIFLYELSMANKKLTRKMVLLK